ncbi:MAG: YicC family protein [Prevotella sp.]|nr:YicC family protein [Candidatus Equicola faecalis]
MILSMTGYGKTAVTFNEKKIHVEIKSLNSKALDISARIAPCYREKEMEMRQMISATLERGKVDFSLWVVKEGCSAATPINADLTQNYLVQLKTLADNIGVEEPQDWMSLLMRMPDVLTKTEDDEVSPEEWAVVMDAVRTAINELMAFRRQEGDALEKKFREKVDNIERLLKEIEPYEKSRVEKIRARITDNLKQIHDVQYDANRLEQELIYYIEKLDISEEKQRLNNHLDYFRKTLTEGTSQGKKLGFIAQEMGREINTTGSKSNNAEMQNIVVMMKDELEQIKEQVLNVM